MIRVEVPGHGVAGVDLVGASANFEPTGWLEGSRATTGDDYPDEVELRVEVLRRLGGLSPRALIGGVLLPHRSHSLTVRVAHAESEMLGKQASELGRRPLKAGLPLEFAQTVVEVLTDSSRPIPGGTLRIMHAGYDEIDSSSVTFGQAAGLLGDVLLAVVEHRDIASAVRESVSRW